MASLAIICVIAGFHKVIYLFDIFLLEKNEKKDKIVAVVRAQKRQ